MMLVLHYLRVPYIMVKADMKTRNKKTEVKYKCSQQERQNNKSHLSWKVSESLRHNG